MKRSIALLKDIINRQSEAHISTHAGSATFYLILSVFPFIMLLVTLIRFFYGSAEMVTSSVASAVPETLKPLINLILTEIYESATTSIIPISTALTLYSASRGIKAMILGLNVIHHSRWNKNFIYQTFIGITYTLAMMASILICLSLLVFGNRLYDYLSEGMPRLRLLRSAFVFWRYLGVFLFLCIIFTISYMVCPNRRLSLWSQLPSALFTTTGWLIFSFFFSFYTDNFGNYTYLYGSLTLIILLMTWCYFLMYLFFLGGVLGAILADRKQEQE